MQSPTARLPVALGWAQTLALFPSCQGWGFLCKLEGPGSLGAALVARLPHHPREPHFERSGLAGDFFENNFIPGVSCKSKMGIGDHQGPGCIGTVNAVAPVSLR